MRSSLIVNSRLLVSGGVGFSPLFSFRPKEVPSVSFGQGRCFLPFRPRGASGAEKAKSHSAADIVYTEELGAELLFGWEEVHVMGVEPQGKVSTAN